MKTTTLPLKYLMNRTHCRFALLIPLALLCFAVSATAEAVSPPPDGAYGTNTAEGQAALLNLTSGTYNTAIGWYSLTRDMAGEFNTAIGAGALFFNLGNPFNDSGNDNTAVGAGALLSNTTGGLNTAIGASALVNNITGAPNTAIGALALFYNTVGSMNTAIGTFALSGNTSGNENTAIGDTALSGNLFGIGGTGSGNTAIGAGSLSHNPTGNNNTAIGYNAGSTSGGDSNIYIGAGVGSTEQESETIRIGDNLTSGTCYIGGISGVTVPDGVGVIIGANGKLGTVVSSERFKEAIKPMDSASEAILALKPVTFHYKHDLDPEGIPQFGLVAEEVEKVNPALVARDEQGKPYTVRYEAVNAMLLNEFLKEHRNVTKLETTVAEQQKQIEALTAGLHQVSAQLELSKSVPQTVLNKK
jgi:hypothetical protein